MTVNEVAVVGFAQTKHRARIRNQSSSDLVYQVTREALDSCSLTAKDIGTLIESSSDYWEGTCCSDVVTMEAAGGYLKEESKVEDDGALAFIYGYLRIRSGLFDTALIVSQTHCSQSPPLPTLSNLSCDPFYQRPIGLEEQAAAALQMTAYMKKYGATEEDVAQVAVKNLGNAVNNPYAHRKVKTDIDRVIKSKVTAYPLRELTSSPTSDGACAVILASGKKAKQITDTPVWIKGIGHSVDDYFLGDRNLMENIGLRSAAKQAYKRASIDNPLKQLDVAEICEPYAHQELLWTEHLGLCGKGQGAKLLREGVTTMNGSLPVNPSGGVLSTNPYVARGLIRIAEASAQLMGKAGKRQVGDAETGLCHSVSGLGGQLHCVVVLGK
ncbi:MAG: thiolase family protein [Thaumarchaeota archaeon]|nr:thiolase family protein [Nitrososphaerota archaeon]